MIAVYIRVRNNSDYLHHLFQISFVETLETVAASYGTRAWEEDIWWLNFYFIDIFRFFSNIRCSRREASLWCKYKHLESSRLQSRLLKVEMWNEPLMLLPFIRFTTLRNLRDFCKFIRILGQPTFLKTWFHLIYFAYRLSELRLGKLIHCNLFHTRIRNCE